MAGWLEDVCGEEETFIIIVMNSEFSTRIQFSTVVLEALFCNRGEQEENEEEEAPRL